MKKKIDILQKYGLNEGELENILDVIGNKPKQVKHNFKDYFDRQERFGVFSDCHIGHKMFDEDFFSYMVNVMRKNRVSRIYQVGDMLEGMSGRDGHIYELSELGFEGQMEKAEEMIGKLDGIQIYGIDGNHDGWYEKKGNGGVVVGEELERRCSNYKHLGQMEGDVQISPRVSMKLFHPNDGTAYATSYKLQKLMESFTGGEKPEIVLEGHYHKALYMFNRNIHGLECGTMCGQTPFMRGKKIPAHKGFWIINIELGKEGIGKFAPEFYPGYK